MGLCTAVVGCSSDENGRSSSSTTKKAPTSTTTKAPVTTTVPGTSASPSTSGAPNTATSGPPVGATTLPPVATGVPSDFGGGVSAVVTGAEKVDVTARVPGETSGPAVAVTLEVRNDSDGPVDLGQLTVTATYGDGVPAVASESDPADALTGSLNAGDRRRGVYVFRVPGGSPDGVEVNVQSATSPNSLLFAL